MCGVALQRVTPRVAEVLNALSNISHHYDAEVISGAIETDLPAIKLGRSKVRLRRSSDDWRSNKHGKRDKDDATTSRHVVLAPDTMLGTLPLLTRVLCHY